MDHPAERAGSGGGRRRLAAGWWSRLAIYVAMCVLAVWMFNREAPRIAEQL